jgi:hypothetical protein
MCYDYRTKSKYHEDTMLTGRRNNWGSYNIKKYSDLQVAFWLERNGVSAVPAY